MYITNVSHSCIDWNIAFLCEDELVHRYWEAVFSKFIISCSVDSGEMNSKGKCILVNSLSGGKYQIQDTNLLLGDIESVIGMSQEIAFSPYFLYSENYTFFHGAVVEKDGQAVLLIAPTQMGKTTITAMLCTMGYKYFSDDVIAVNNNDLTVVTFPKVLTVRNMGVLRQYKRDFDLYMDILKFKDKSIDNTSKEFEERFAMFPKETEEVVRGKKYVISRIYVLNRQVEFGEKSSVRQYDEVTGFLCLLKNLRSTYNLTKSKDVAGRLNANTPIYELQYGYGFKLLNYF